MYIGVGRFRILGGQGLQYWGGGGGGQGGPNSKQAHDVVTNQCQIITFLVFKYDIIENSRIELRGIVLPVQVGGLLCVCGGGGGGGGGQRVCWPSLSNYWGGALAPLPPPPPPPSSCAYDVRLLVSELLIVWTARADFSLCHLQ